MHDAFINSKLYICICVQNIHIMFKCMYIQNNQNIYIYTHSTYPLLIFDALNIYDMVLIYYIIFTYIFHCLDHALERRIVVDRLVRRESHRATQWKDINLSTPDIHGGPKKTGGCCEVMRSW